MKLLQEFYACAKEYENGADDAVLDRLAREFIDMMEGRRYYRTSGAMAYYLHDRCFSEKQRSVLHLAASAAGENRTRTREDFHRLQPYKPPAVTDTIPDLLIRNITEALKMEYRLRCDAPFSAAEKNAELLRDLLKMAEGAPIRLYMYCKPSRFFAAIL